MSTSIEDLLAKFDDRITGDRITDDTQKEIQKDKEPQDKIFDFSLSQEERIDALNWYFTIHPENITETISKLNSIYCMSPIGLMRKFIYEVAMYSELPLHLRIDCAITLADIDVSRDLGLKCLNNLIDYMDTTIPTPCKLEYILKLVNSDFKERILTLYEFICDARVDTAYRYRVILMLENNVKTMGDEINGFNVMIEACKIFLKDINTLVQYRILACQNILSRRPDIRDNSCELATSQLIEFMLDPDLPHNLRADSADVILHFGTDRSIELAMNTLKELGGRDIYNIYDNKENAHLEEVEESVNDTIKYIDALNLNPIPPFYTVSYNIQQSADKLYPDEEDKEGRCEKVRASLLRIELDRTVFKNLNHTLQSILCHLYAYIQTHDLRESLEVRLIEELIDMAGTCSTGYISRLVNTLSGYGEHTLKISWSDQIAANLSGRLNARMKTHPDLDIIVEQMINKNISDRSVFLKFFRENISSIKEEMYQEFREHMEDCDWDLWFGSAIINYIQ